MISVEIAGFYQGFIERRTNGWFATHKKLSGIAGPFSTEAKAIRWMMDTFVEISRANDT